MPHTQMTAVPPTQQGASTAKVALNVLQHALQTSVGLMEIAVQMSSYRESQLGGEKTRRSELVALSALGKRFDAALKIPAKASEELRIAIGRIAKAGRRELEQAFDELNLNRQGRDEAHRLSVDARCHALVATLLTHQLLPESQTSLSWSARGGVVDAQLAAAWGHGLRTAFRVVISHEELWSKPVRVSELGSVVLPELVTRPWSAPRWKERKLGGHFIVEATWTDAKRELVLARRAHGASPGYRVSFDASGAVTLLAIDEDGNPTTAPRTLDGEVASSFLQLWQGAAQELSTWTRRRRQLVHAELNGHPLSAAPDAVAMAILDAYGPYINQLGEARGRLCDESLWQRIRGLSEPLRILLASKLTPPASPAESAPRRKLEVVRPLPPRQARADAKRTAAPKVPRRMPPGSSRRVTAIGLGR